MVLSKREKYIAIGAAAAVGLLALNSLVLGPYESKLDDLANDKKASTQTLQDNTLLIYKQKSMQTGWQQMLSNGLEADDSVAQSQTQQSLQQWSREANINLDALSSERVQTQHSPFQGINFNLDFNTSGRDSMRQIARMLWSIETANIPLRLTDLKLQSTKEGTDQLNVKLVVSSLYMPPTGDAAAAGGNDSTDDTGDTQQ